MTSSRPWTCRPEGMRRRMHFQNCPSKVMAKRRSYFISSGIRFGRLLTTGASRYRSPRHKELECTCDCGNTTYVAATNLVRNTVQSCGCHRDDVNRNRLTTHGEGTIAKLTAEYRIWRNMKQRCNNANNPKFADYGGRGITVCDRWIDYPVFLADMGRRPTSKHSIERRNNDLGYSPDNCYWATHRQQVENRRVTRWVCWDDNVMPITRAARHFGIHPRTVRSRIKDSGWSVSKALTTPIQSKRAA